MPAGPSEPSELGTGRKAAGTGDGISLLGGRSGMLRGLAGRKCAKQLWHPVDFLQPPCFDSSR